MHGRETAAVTWHDGRWHRLSVARRPVAAWSAQVLELPGPDKAAIEVETTKRTLLIRVDRRDQQQPASQLAEDDGSPPATTGPLLSRRPEGPS